MLVFHARAEASYPVRVSGKGLWGNRENAAYFRDRVDAALALIEALEMPVDRGVLAVDVQFTDGPIERSAINDDMRVVFSGGRLVEARIGFLLPKSMPMEEAAALIVHEVGHVPFEILKVGGTLPRGASMFLPSYVELWCDALSTAILGEKDIVARALSRWTGRMSNITEADRREVAEQAEYRRFSVRRDPSTWREGRTHTRLSPARFAVGALFDEVGPERALSILLSCAMESALWEAGRLLAGDIAAPPEANAHLIAALTSAAHRPTIE